jgi:putative peptide zinc metalloprotease protein
MNLSEALNAALPELPARRARTSAPQLDPAVVGREQIEEGAAVIVAHRPGTSSLFHLTPEQWQVLQLFDGQRSFREIGDACEGLLGVQIAEDEVKQFAANLETLDLWYKSPQEKNLALMEKLVEERSKHTKKKSKIGDISHIQFSAWDPDKFVTWAHGYLTWAFSRWFTTATLIGFGFMFYVFFDRWSEIGPDTLKYYTFTEKTFGDLAEFWVLFLILGFFHESTHALVCKHYGGGVHRMGFHLIYLTPAFFVDVTEAWVYANRWQRLATIIAGIWVELIFCAVATFIWWGTAPGSFAHEFSYKIMLITGVAVILVNLNPLIKLDGYYFFSELLDVQGLKERSTAYLSSWTKKHIWRLDVEVEFVPRRLKGLFVPYALLSGIYSYALLLFATFFARNVFAKFSPEWAFLPATILGLYIFRSRIRTLGRFMKSVYLDKRERLHALAKNRILVGAAAAITLFVFFAPIWRDNVDAYFIVEPTSRVTLRAEVPGVVIAVHKREGEPVAAGDALLELRDLASETRVGRSRSDLDAAELEGIRVVNRQSVDGGSVYRLQSASQYKQIADSQAQKLKVVAPAAGVVITPRVHDHLGKYVAAGTELVEIADLAHIRARVFVPEFESARVQEGASVRLFFYANGDSVESTVSSIFTQPQSLPPGVFHQESFKGMREVGYFPVLVELPANVAFGDGRSGAAKIFIARRSLAEFGWKVMRDFALRKLW